MPTYTFILFSFLIILLPYYAQSSGKPLHLGGGRRMSHHSPSSLLSNVCSETPYPNICKTEMFAASNQTSLLTIVLFYTQSASTRISQTLFVAKRLSKHLEASRPPGGLEKQALQDCIQLLSDAKDELRSVVSDLKASPNLSASGWGDVRTWTSAGLTDEDTCSDEMASYAEDKLTRPFKVRLSYLSQVISNALYLLAKVAGAGAP